MSNKKTITAYKGFGQDLKCCGYEDVLVITMPMRQ